MTPPFVLLVNHALGITCQTASVSGHSRKSYGHSRYDQQRNAHVLEMSLEDYEKAVSDIARNWHKSRCKWVPHFIMAAEPVKVVEPQNSPELREIALGWASKLGKDDIAFLAEKHGLLANRTTDEPPVAGAEWPHKWFSLIGLAKREGVDTTGMKNAATVQAAILAKRAERQQAA